MSALHYIERPASGTPRGLLVLLHGVGANEGSLWPLALELPADLQVVLVRAPLALGPGMHAWFPVRFTAEGPQIDAAQADASRRALIDFIAEQQTRLGIVPSRTLVAGFSQGGIMSASVALTSPASVAGFGVLSGRILPEIEPLIPADIASHALHGLVLHGTRDSKLGYFFAERAQALLAGHGVAHALKAYDADHELTPQMRADFVAWVEARLPEFVAV
ncbi:phospholipase [Pseudoxanthomonas sp.]|uniref:alpha/beta hydrolase n=1 Tax=Pseudoxanthomonas sp. TaxID=1871049 RepID=UPI0026378793|nr:phospholipase [Pseudoxanthomonas sp.]WDS35061.1 MAG: phospholipase [Pseudoxanthomonas sp.]